jgi:CheY-like chemotaxis protein
LHGQGSFADRAKFPYPSLLLLDLHLPLQSGFEVLDWLRRNPQPQLKAIVCTGTATPAEVEKAYKLGAEEVFQKTADFKQFILHLTQLPELQQIPQPKGIEWRFA